MLARSFSAAFLSAASAAARSAFSISMSNTLPWRTLAMPPTPSERSAPSMALPWGSRTPDFNVTVTRAFMVMLLSGRQPLDREESDERPRLFQPSVVVDLRQRQRNVERRQFDRVGERAVALFCES